MSEAAIARAEFDAPRQGRRFSVVVGAAMAYLMLVVLAALFGRALAPHDPAAQDLLRGLSPPGRAHWLGTDDLGRDILSRTIAGARTALVGPFLVAAGSMFLGSALGVVAGYHGRRVDMAIMRAVDVIYALPGLLVAIVVVGVLGGGYYLAAALLIVLFSPVDTRLIRGATLEQRGLAYVEAARTLGLSDARVMFRHIWPNVLPIAIGNACLTFAFALVSLSALSFLGLGVPPGTADWGWMLADSRTLLFDNAAAALAPGIALVLTAAAVNIVGDWAFERLSDRGRAR